MTPWAAGVMEISLGSLTYLFDGTPGMSGADSGDDRVVAVWGHSVAVDERGGAHLCEIRAMDVVSVMPRLGSLAVSDSKLTAKTALDHGNRRFISGTFGPDLATAENHADGLLGVGCVASSVRCPQSGARAPASVQAAFLLVPELGERRR